MSAKEKESYIEKQNSQKEQLRASTEFPDLTPEEALQKRVLARWIHNQWFVKDGIRHIIRRDIQYDHPKAIPRLWENLSRWRSTTETQTYVDYWDSPVPLKDVDRVTEKTLAAREAIGIHPSEGGWNLPRSHPRHLLNFPQEILDKIIGYNLIIGEDVGSIAPIAMTSNKNSDYQEAHYQIARSPYPGPVREDLPRNGYRVYAFAERYQPVSGLFGDTLFERGPQSIKKSKLSDEFGPYIQMQNILRLIVDASCLRACKAFQSYGTEMLYRHNTFKFDISTYMNTRKYMMYDQDGPRSSSTVLKPDRHIESVGVIQPYNEWLVEVKDAVSQVKQSVSDKDLAGWAYQDPFVRFLYNIGPENAKLIKSLQFSGNMKTHRCSPGDDHHRICGEGFMMNFLIYLQFIHELCPHLEKLVLNIAPDVHRRYQDKEWLRWSSFQENLTPFLKTHIRKLQTVKTLVLCTRNEAKPAQQNYLYEPMKFPLAVETCKWFEERAKGWASNA
ncbi:hypothetical protein BTUL_0114g00010 [Botrytis tulipae]|uniref:Uncharacterized protein n=1 Tax=Botrytis tulipae TaxID=87230 RepID=A0A4Z1EFJ9_9HELO|nr:hypothetical protein BTUL_0114g00010 [Botrytis tulipae]